MNLQLPRRREENLWIRRVHDNVNRARVAVDKEHALPVRAANSGAIPTPFLLRSVTKPPPRDKDDIRIVRIDDDTSNTTTRVEPHLRPRMASVGRLVYAVPGRYVTSNPALAGASPHHVGV